MNDVTVRDNGEVIDAGAHIPENMALVKLENDQIFSMAAARPRNHVKIREDLLGQLDAYPSFAKSVVYCKPVGKDKDGRMQFARGLSIRAAEALAEAYGFNRVRSDVTIIDPDTVKIEASFTDYQRGRVWQDAGILSRFYRDRTGRMVRYADDRFNNLIVKAEVSKRIREVIVRSVPPGLRSELMEMAERKIDELLDDATVTKIIAQFAGKSVTLEMLEDHIGRTLKSGWTKDDRVNLLGLWNSIKDGEINVAEAFAKEKPADAQTNGGGPGAGATAAAMIKPREVAELPKPPVQTAKPSMTVDEYLAQAKAADAAKPAPSTSAPAFPDPTKPIPESTKTDAPVENQPETNPKPTQTAEVAPAASITTPIPQPVPQTPTPAATPSAPEKRRPGRPRKQVAPEAAVGAGNAVPNVPADEPPTMFTRPTWLDEAEES